MTRGANVNASYNANGLGAFAPDFHFEMLSDTERVSRILNAMARYGHPDKTFCELGCGAGLFAIEAARIFHHVYAIDHDKLILAVARRAALKAGVESKITFIEADACAIDRSVIGPRIDVMFAEMLSIWLIDEPQVLALNNAFRKNLLAEGAVVIPSRVVNLIEAANQDFTFGRVDLKTPIPQFVAGRAPRVMTSSEPAYVVDFSQVIDRERKGRVKLVALADDVINCVRLSSIVQFAPGATFYSTNTLMSQTIVPTENEVEVSFGDPVEIAFSFRHRSSLTDATFRILT